MAKYDVGIFGLWYGRNYGSISTYFALKTVVEAMGYSTVMIENPLNSDSLNVDALPMSHPRRFARDHYTITPRYRLPEMGKLNELCGGFLLGSDQMWNYGLSRAYKEAYFLDFAADSKVKVAYATSFGKYPYNGPASYKPTIRKCLDRFTGISVRDDFSQRILKEEIGIDAEQLLDPVFLCPRSAYEGLIAEGEALPYKDYIFAYILDPNPEIGQSLLYAAEESGKQIIIAFNELSDKKTMMERLKVKDKRLITLNDIPVSTWLACFQNANFVLTDSFHGACFSVIFERPFVVLKNNRRGGGRFNCLLSTLGLMNRMVEDPSLMGIAFSALSDFEEIDYSAVKETIGMERERGIKWLEQALRPIHSSAVTAVLAKEKCVGCGACVSACPVNAIRLKADRWGYYRSFVDYETCINCGKCTQICPALQLPVNVNKKSPDCYEFVSSDEQVLRRSSSGGIFSTLAGAILAEGGAVVGAAWKDDFTVNHIVAENEEELQKLQKSKYLQSYVGDIFRRVKKLLDSGRLVLFTGTPCQVTGLRAYLGKDYDNLLAVDILCGNAPSPMFFKKYIDETFGNNLKIYEFRHKSDEIRWDAMHIQATLRNGDTIVHNGARDDNYQRVYHNHTMCPPHCENCRFQAFPRVGDISIGDFWKIKNHDPALDTFKGVSLVLCNSAKGERFFKRIPADRYAVMKKVPLEWMGGNGYSRNGGKNWISASRDLFYDAIAIMPFSKAVNYALKPNHGQFRNAYRGTNTPLRLDYKMLHFTYESNVWEEVSVEGKTTLIVKENKWKETGHYARLPMAGMLKKDRTYRLSVKFRIHSQSEILNFHLIDSGSKQLQVIHSERITGRCDGNQWIEIATSFVPNTDYYDEFMFGATHVSGLNNYLMIAYLDISEEL